MKSFINLMTITSARKQMAARVSSAGYSFTEPQLYNLFTKECPSWTMNEYAYVNICSSILYSFASGRISELPVTIRELFDPNYLLDHDENSKTNSQVNVSTTDMFECPKCHKRKCVYYTLQTRSADESETIFVTCLECDNKFRR